MNTKTLITAGPKTGGLTAVRTLHEVLLSGTVKPAEGQVAGRGWKMRLPRRAQGPPRNDPGRLGVARSRGRRGGSGRRACA